MNQSRIPIENIILNLILSEQMIAPIMAADSTALITALNKLGYKIYDIKKIMIDMMKSDEIRKAYTSRSKSMKKGKSIEEAISMRIPPHIKHMNDDDLYKQKQESRDEVKAILKILGSNEFIDKQKIHHEELTERNSIGEIPTRSEIELLVREAKGEMDVDDLKKAIETIYNKDNRVLHPDWWKITVKSFEK